jgi:hypothetical protein
MREARGAAHEPSKQSESRWPAEAWPAQSTAGPRRPAAGRRRAQAGSAGRRPAKAGSARRPTLAIATWTSVTSHRGPRVWATTEEVSNEKFSSSFDSRRDDSVHIRAINENDQSRRHYDRKPEGRSSRPRIQTKRWRSRNGHQRCGANERLAEHGPQHWLRDRWNWSTEITKSPFAKPRAATTRGFFI